MRVAICTPGAQEHQDYRGGDLLGTESQILGLATELERSGNEISIIRKWTSAESRELLSHNIELVNVRSRGFKDGLLKGAITKIAFSRHALREVNRISPDVIVMSEIISSYCVAFSKCPKVFVTHNPPSGLYLNEGVARGSLKRLIETQVFSRCDALVALNEAIEKRLAERGYRTVRIPNGVNIDDYPTTTSDCKFVLAGGRLVELKGLDCLIRAFSELHKYIRDEYELVIVGYGPEEEGLKRLSVKLGLQNRVRFIPWLRKSEFVEILSQCTVFALPSLWECMPVSLLEAMACAKPTISSDIPGPREVIHDHRDGLLFEKGNVAQLKEKLGLLLTDKSQREKIGKTARETIRQRFTFQAIAAQYEKLFQELLN